MRAHFGIHSGARAFACCLFVLFFAGAIFGQTYTTIANGNWSSSSTWQGGSVPPTGVTLPATATINIRHTVLYDTGNTYFANAGEIRIQPTSGTNARLNLPTGVTLETVAGGRFFIINAQLIQCRFANCSNGQPYDVNNMPTAQQNTGTFRNSGGQVEVRSSIVEIAEFWINYGGTEAVVGSCMTVGHTYALKGKTQAFSNSTISRSSISLGWHGVGQFELANANATFQAARFQVAGAESSGFNLLSGTVGGDIDYITLSNHVVPFTGHGLIFVSETVNVNGVMNLDAYCGKPLSLQDNNKFSGAQSLNCDLTFFPANCSVTVPSAAGARVEGRVLTANGVGIAKAVVEISGGELGQPMRALTNGFGYFRLEDIPVGNTYVVTVTAKQHTFSEPSRVVSLLDNLGEVDFIADAANGTRKARP